MHHLDTSIVAAYLRGSRSVADRIKELLPEVGLSTLVLAELLYGARVSARTSENLERIGEFSRTIKLVGFDANCAEAYGRIRFGLRRHGRPSGEIDTLVAAVALANNAVLVTHNVKHFEAIEELRIEDWLSAPNLNSGNVPESGGTKSGPTPEQGLT